MTLDTDCSFSQYEDMVSVPPPPPAGDRPTGRERILAAAISCFAANGVDGTSLKRVAEEAEVSPALIVHHFGTKDGLQEACDDEVIGIIRDQLRIAAAEVAQVDVLAAFRRRQETHASALPYLARALSDGAPSVVELVDELAEATLVAADQNVANGVYRPSEHQRERALVLLIWSLGALTLHQHVERLLGADLTGEPAALLPYLRGATEMLAGGLFTETMESGVRDAIAHLEQETS
jgi:AcrR family transcriptional regulator